MPFCPDLVGAPPILDFEASSLDQDHSYPIAVGAVAEGRTFYRLIRPKDEWDDWSMASEDIHGFSRDQLLSEGTSVDQVLKELQSFLSGAKAAYSDAFFWDRLWATRLGLRSVRVGSIFELLGEDEAEAFDDTLSECFESFGLKRHCAIDDAIAISHAFLSLKRGRLP